MGFILSGIYFGWGSLKTGFSFGEIRVRRDSVLARFALGEIHFGGISDDGFWNGGILSYRYTLTWYNLHLHQYLAFEPNFGSFGLDEKFIKIEARR